MARRNDHSREQIHQMAIDAAIQLLNTEGANSLSTRKVAKVIGYSAGTLYLVFKNLDELILSVNAATLEELQLQMQQATAEYPNEPQQALCAMAMAYLSYAQQYYARWSLLFTHQLPDGQPLPAWLEERIQQPFVLVEQLLMKLKPAADQYSYQLATRTLWSSVHGICELALSNKLTIGTQLSTKALIETLIDHYLTGFTQR